MLGRAFFIQTSEPSNKAPSFGPVAAIGHGPAQENPAENPTDEILGLTLGDGLQHLVCEVGRSLGVRHEGNKCLMSCCYCECDVNEATYT